MQQNMRIIHTADLHLGQVIYQSYDRVDEHEHFFRQLSDWCEEYSPDALVVSGDVFDIQQPSAAVKQHFNRFFASLRRRCPGMAIVVSAGNHDSGSRIEADDSVWRLADARTVGVPPSLRGLMADDGDDVADRYIVSLPSGFVVAVPYAGGDRTDIFQPLLDRVEALNSGNLPVVMMAHLAVRGSDTTGHDFEIGKVGSVDLSGLGHGFDYLALGHIHRPQTLDHPESLYEAETEFSAPVARYSGSALHVSCDETYPHSVSLVDIDSHGGSVKVRQLPVSQLRHFYILPEGKGSYLSEEEAIAALTQFCADGKTGYFRFRMDYSVDLSADFNQKVYDIIQPLHGEVRYNPKILWTGSRPAGSEESLPVFEVAELSQMADPMEFIEKTADRYAGFTIEELREAFEEVRKELES